MLEDKKPISPYITQENLRTVEACISKTFNLNDIKFGTVAKILFCIAFQKFESVAPNLHNIVLYEVI